MYKNFFGKLIVVNNYYNVHFTFNNVHFTFCNVHFTFYNVHFTFNNVHFTFNNVRLTFYNVRLTFYNVHFTMYILNVHFTMYILQCTLHILVRLWVGSDFCLSSPEFTQHSEAISSEQLENLFFPICIMYMSLLLLFFSYSFHSRISSEQLENWYTHIYKAYNSNEIWSLCLSLFLSLTFTVYFFK